MGERRLSSSVLELDRRGFLVNLSTAAWCLLLPACAREDAGIDAAERFYSLSQLLTGFAELDDSLAEVYRSSIEADADRAAALERLYQAGGFHARPPESLAELEASGALELEAEIADQITLMWYSGIHVTADGEPQVATHLDALCWRALNTNPPSQCGGALGFWSAGV